MYTKPFTEKALYYANCISELGLAVIIPLITMFLFDLSESSQNTLDLLLIVVINIILGSQMFSSLFIAGKTIYSRFKNKNNDIAPDHVEEKKHMNIHIYDPEEESKDNYLQFSYEYAKINISPVSSICQNSYIEGTNELNFKSNSNNIE